MSESNEASLRSRDEPIVLLPPEARIQIGVQVGVQARTHEPCGFYRSFQSTAPMASATCTFVVRGRCLALADIVPPRGYGRD